MTNPLRSGESDGFFGKPTRTQAPLSSFTFGTPSTSAGFGGSTSSGASTSSTTKPNFSFPVFGSAFANDGQSSTSISNKSNFGKGPTLECTICLEQLDKDKRVPKVMPCGHTVCLQCMQRLSDKNCCPTCRQKFDGAPEDLPNNFMVLQLLEEVRPDWTPRAWCLDCCTAVVQSCWDKHDVLPSKRALKHKLHGVLQKAAFELPTLDNKCQGDQAMQALTLMAGESWNVTVQGKDHKIEGTVGKAEDPLIQAMWLIMAAKITCKK